MTVSPSNNHRDLRRIGQLEIYIYFTDFKTLKEIIPGTEEDTSLSAMMETIFGGTETKEIQTALKPDKDPSTK